MLYELLVEKGAGDKGLMNEESQEVIITPPSATMAIDENFTCESSVPVPRSAGRKLLFVENELFLSVAYLIHIHQSSAYSQSSCDSVIELIL